MVDWYCGIKAGLTIRERDSHRFDIAGVADGKVLCGITAAVMWSEFVRIWWARRYLQIRNVEVVNRSVWCWGIQVDILVLKPSANAPWPRSNFQYRFSMNMWSLECLSSYTIQNAASLAGRTNIGLGCSKEIVTGFPGQCTSHQKHRFWRFWIHNTSKLESQQHHGKSR